MLNCRDLNHSVMPVAPEQGSTSRVQRLKATYGRPPPLHGSAKEEGCDDDDRFQLQRTYPRPATYWLTVTPTILAVEVP